MNFIKRLGQKTWIDWLKIVVALDIASVGIGLIIGLRFHVLADIFGFITRIPLGVMYVFVAVLILKRVFPAALRVDENNEIGDEGIDLDIKNSVKEGKKITKKIIEKVEKVSDKIIEKVDQGLDKTEDFIKERKKEAKNEIEDLLNK